jgi:hypothetical protein
MASPPEIVIDPPKDRHWSVVLFLSFRVSLDGIASDVREGST